MLNNYRIPHNSQKLKFLISLRKHFFYNIIIVSSSKIIKVKIHQRKIFGLMGVVLDKYYGQ